MYVLGARNGFWLVVKCMSITRSRSFKNITVLKVLNILSMT